MCGGASVTAASSPIALNCQGARARALAVPCEYARDAFSSTRRAGLRRRRGQRRLGQTVEDEARVRVLGEREQQAVQGCALVGVERREELVLDAVDDGAEATELALAGCGEADE